LPEAQASARAIRLGLHPVGAIHLAFFALMATAVLLGGDRVPLRLPLLALNLGALAAIVLAENASRRMESSKASLVRLVVTCTVIPIAFTQLGWIIPHLRPSSAEDLLLAIDHWLFGVNPTQWAERFHHPWLTEILQWIYATFYFLPLVLAARLIAGRRFTDVDVSLAVVALGFYTSYIGYFAVPAVSPYRVLPHSFPLEGVWAAEAIRRTLERLENTVHDCFPSGHTEVSLLVLWCAWRFDRIAFALLAAPVMLLLASTVYLRYHYGIDLLAGAAFAFLVVLLVRPIEARIRRAGAA
jgi:membrane-associated phospholipid phosphatase